MMTEARQLQFLVTAEIAGQRLDTALAQLFPQVSRSHWQKLIRQGLVSVNGIPRRPHYKVREHDTLTAIIPPPQEPELVPREMPLDVLYEDHELIVINKPAGLVVHPAPGHWDDTLVNALLHHCRDLQPIGGSLRPGIVHRLDKDTSGVLLVAKNERALNFLAAQFKQRTVRKLYLALVAGVPSPPEGIIRTEIGRSDSDRKKMTSRPRRGRYAETEYRIKENYRTASLLEVLPLTGRTHQIRVHMAHIGHPILGDPQYGRRRLRHAQVSAPRQMLHAASLTFIHPSRGEMTIRADIPQDMARILDELRSQHTDGHARSLSVSHPRQQIP